MRALRSIGGTLWPLAACATARPARMGRDAGRIVTLHGGVVPAVEFLEGCNP